MAGLAGGRPGQSGGGASPASRAVHGACRCAGEKREERNERRRRTRPDLLWPSGPARPVGLRSISQQTPAQLWIKRKNVYLILEFLENDNNTL
jgi:hypothetical protein